MLNDNKKAAAAENMTNFQAAAGTMKLIKFLSPMRNLSICKLFLMGQEDTDETT